MIAIVAQGTHMTNIYSIHCKTTLYLVRILWQAVLGADQSFGLKGAKFGEG